MTQAIEFTKLRRCETPRPSWLGWLRARLFGPAGGDCTIPLEASSPHLLRDIGLAEDVRTNHLLQDHLLFRR
jgi:hypothetical protein